MVNNSPKTLIIKTFNIGPWLELFSSGLNEDLTFGKIYTEKHVEDWKKRRKKRDQIVTNISSSQIFLHETVG